MTPRIALSAKARKAFFKERGGLCALCGGVINPVKEAWEIEHTNPLAMTGTNDPLNLTLAHSRCHKVKSRDDAKNIAKAKRRETKHVGATPPPKARIPQRPPVEQPIRDRLPIPPRTHDIFGRRL